MERVGERASGRKGERAKGREGDGEVKRQKKKDKRLKFKV